MSTSSHCPSPLSVEVPEVDALLLAAVDAGNGAGDLSCYERGPAAGALVVEQNAVRQVHAVRLKTFRHTETVSYTHLTLPTIYPV